MRYRFYREHKYLTFLLFELERLIAKSDFRKNEQILKVKKKLDFYVDLLKDHASHEEEAIHILLKKKGSFIYEQIEADHRYQEEQSFELKGRIDAILVAEYGQKISLGYDFYLFYRLYLIENLQHFYKEETIINLELQKLYSDDELKTVDHHTYHHMTPEEMTHMMQELIPHMDPNDKAFFLNDIKEATPLKFIKLSAALNEEVLT